MFCIGCKKETGNGIRVGKLKYGYICRDCLERLPVSVRHKTAHLSLGQVSRLLEICSRQELPALEDSIYFTRTKRFVLCADSIFVNGVRIGFQDIRRVYLVYHPLEDCGSNMARVQASLCIRVKGLCMILEEDIEAPIAMAYTIDRKTIQFHYSDGFTEYIQKLNEALAESVTLDALLEEINLERKKKKREEQENARREGNTRGARGHRQSAGKAGTGVSPLEKAMAMFCVQMPYAEADIKKTRNKLLKKYHPDEAGGSAEACIQVMEAFELLKKYAQ